MNAKGENVILLHGLGRTSFAMRPLEYQLKEDYNVVNQGYPSQKFPIAKLAEVAIIPALEKCEPAQIVHFVTHSLGGILIRQFLQQNNIPNLGRTVMLGPPNQGSELADAFSDYRVFEMVNGPAGLELGTHTNSVPNQLGKANFELGVIAGNQSFNPLFSSVFSGEDDGKVSVERSKLDGMADHLVLPVTHTFMMRNPLVISQTKYFLEHGFFDKDQK